MAIDKINGTAFTNVANLDGVAKVPVLPSSTGKMCQ